MKKKIFVLFILLILISLFDKTTFEVHKKEVLLTRGSEANNYNQVTDRDLALLASLTYEPVPDENNYKIIGNKKPNSSVYQACTFNSDGTIKRKCSFYYDNNLSGKIGDYTVKKYVEGMSERKVKSSLGMKLLTAFFPEEGEVYYFDGLANTNETSDWEIIDYQRSDSTLLSINNGKNGYFDAITYHKKNTSNYVIAYRGTDFPDILEWIMDIEYAIVKIKETKFAEEYATSQYQKIINTDANAKIYVTGHSLGAYLAQIGGAAIVQQGKSEDYSGIEFDSSSSKNLEGIVYFNGMGIDALGKAGNKSVINLSYSQWIKRKGNALYWLATHDTNGRISNSKEKVTYGNNSSSGRLILYRMDGDPVSAIGLHYGEVYEISGTVNAVDNHLKRYSLSLASIIDNILLEPIITPIIENIKELTKELKQTYGKKYSEGVSESIYSMIAGKEFITEKSDDKDLITDEVIESFNDNRRQTIINPIGSMLRTINAAKEKYKLGNMVEAANVNHETDSFLSLFDNRNESTVPNPSNIILSVSGINEKSSTSETEKEYWFNGKNEVVLNVKTTNVPILYIELIKPDGSKLVERRMSMKFTANDSKDVTYKFRVYYGNDLHSVKQNDDGSYSTDKIYNTPNYKEYIMNLKIDKVAPTCNAMPNEIRIEKVCQMVTKEKGWLIKRTVTEEECSYPSQSYSPSCSDNLSGVSNIAIYEDVDDNSLFLGLFKKLIVTSEGDKIIISPNNSSKKPTKVKIKGLICDKAGNCFNASNLKTISGNEYMNVYYNKN